MARILVVDDEKRWRIQLSQTLQRSGHTVYTAGTLADAERILRTQPCQIALLDIDLDGSGLAGDGGQLFDLLCCEYPTIPVVAVTGAELSLQDVRNLFVECRIKDFVTKGDLNITTFRKRIDQILSSPSPGVVEPQAQRGLLETPIDPNDPPIGLIRALLHAAFSAPELGRFCLDRKRFRPICDQFAAAQGLAERVDQVLEYCRTHLLWDELLAAVEKANPAQYAAFTGQLSGPTTPTEGH
jgi:CheY-like chemotaxis protein